MHSIFIVPESGWGISHLLAFCHPSFLLLRDSISHLEKAMATHSSTLTWRIPWTEEPGRLSPWGRQELDTTEWLHFHFSLSCTGEGGGNPLQYSCLENPRGRGACWSAVYGVAQSRTQMMRLSNSSSSISHFKLNLSGIKFTSEIVWWACVLLVSLTPPGVTPVSFQVFLCVSVSPSGNLRPPQVLRSLNSQFLLAPSEQVF